MADYRAYTEGQSIRGTERITGIHRHTIMGLGASVAVPPSCMTA
jgi:hypothetical protein